MAGISSYDSNSISTLFSSLPVYKQGSNSAFTAINLADYSCIKSGSYYKLMKSYYAQEGKEVTSKKDKTSIATSEDSTELLSNIKKTSGELTQTATELYKDSNLVKDDEKLLSKVKEFVSDYNSAIKSVSKTETSSIASAGANLINYTNTNSSMLESVGIKINEKDYTLSLDESKFKEAGSGNKSILFKGSGSYAYNVGVKSSMINSQASREAGKSNTYGKSGSYSNNFSSGSVLDSLF